MSTPYPPQPRRLMRDPSNKVIGGVCSGVAKYLNMDVNLVRVLTVIISLFTGVPIVLYLIALFVLPEEGAQPPPQPPYVNGPPAGNYGAPAGYGQPWQQTYGQQAQAPAPAPASAPAPGPTPSPAPGPDPVWGANGAPWEQPQTAASAPQPPAPAPDPQPPSWPEPATAIPEETPAAAPTPEPLPETEVVGVASEETSTWESAPAEPVAAEVEPREDEVPEGGEQGKPQG